MVVCVECGSPVNCIYKEFSRGSIRLTTCEQCGKVADKYVECDILIIFIDLILHREAAYRHVLFNRLKYFDTFLDTEIFKFFFAIIFFDTYTNWFVLGRYYSINSDKCSINIPDNDILLYNNTYIDIDNNIYNNIYPTYNIYNNIYPTPFQGQMNVMLGAGLGFITYLVIICILVRLYIIYKYKYTNIIMIKYNYLIAAIILSCFGKLGTLLMMIWDTDMRLRHTISFFIATSNVIAIKVFLNIKSSITPIVIICIAHIFKWLVECTTMFINPVSFLTVM
eukprot:GHVL01012790.1.p1 GENE.GHVL01012790.1~~GHVL01012790.1.p1  ORF type:complete len:280 (+),score=61.84 GHVL01012790.1:63-902(+)